MRRGSRRPAIETSSQCAAFPDDVYDLAPATWTDVDESLQEPGIASGRVEGLHAPQSSSGSVTVHPTDMPARGSKNRQSVGAGERGVVVGTERRHFSTRRRWPATEWSSGGSRRVRPSPHVRTPILRQVAERLVVIGGDAGGMAAASAGAPHAARPRDRRARAGPLHQLLGLRHPVPRRRRGRRARRPRRARSPQELRDRLRIDVRMRHEVDRHRRRRRARSRSATIEHDRTFRLGFDQLLIGTGGVRSGPTSPASTADHVHGVQTLDDAQAPPRPRDAESLQHVVVVGGGYIGLEMAEAFVQPRLRRSRSSRRARR